MDPPEAFAPPSLDPVAAADLHPFLRELTEQHAGLSRQLDVVEEVLQAVESSGFTAQADRALMRFLEAFDRDFVPHSRAEEGILFPLLRERLVAHGEHSKGKVLTTPVDVMAREHLKAIQLAAVVLNLIRVGSCLPDPQSARIVVGAALKEAANLVELLRLHMFREDNILFASAQRLLSTAELTAMCAAAERPREKDE